MKTATQEMTRFQVDGGAARIALIQNVRASCINQWGRASARHVLIFSELILLIFQNFDLLLTFKSLADSDWQVILYKPVNP